MLKHVFKILVLCFISSGYLFAQNASSASDGKQNPVFNTSVPVDPPSDIDGGKKLGIVKTDAKDNEQVIKSIMFDQFYKAQTNHNQKTQTALQDLKSRFASLFGENMRFDGFHNHYAVLNFTPAVHISPFDFITINASENLSCYIPVKDIKEHFGPLLMHGAALLAVDNSVKLFFGTGRMLPSIAGFVVKNIITSLIIALSNKESNNGVYSNNNYYYSINIRF